MPLVKFVKKGLYANRVGEGHVEVRADGDTLEVGDYCAAYCVKHELGEIVEKAEAEPTPEKAEAKSQPAPTPTPPPAPDVDGDQARGKARRARRARRESAGE